MEKQIIEIIKDLFISLLIVICIVLVLSIFLYDDVSLSKIIPEAEDYVLTDEMQKELENTKLDETEEIIVNYYIDASDLRKYEKTNEYNMGKNNPFSTSEISNNIDNTMDIENNSSSNNNSSGNFYEDDGTK